MTSKTYAFLIFLFFFSLPRCCSGLFLYLFFLPFVKPMHSHTHTGRITQCHFHSDKTRAGSSAVLIKSEEGDAAPRPPSCFFFFSFFYIFLEGAEKEGEWREGAGSIKLDLMSKRGAAGFFVNTRQIKSADEPIVVAGNCFFCAQV